MKLSDPPVTASAQQQLLFVDRMRGGRSVDYVRPVALRLRGSLDTDALIRAIHMIVERHEVLRTCFSDTHGGTPVQLIHRDWRPRIAVERLEDYSEDRAEEWIEKTLGQEAGTPFDLFAGPPVRFRLLKLSDGDHVLVRCIHHIAFDRWSESVWNKELGALYSAYREGADAPLPPPPLQYADYAQWQQDELAGNNFHAGLEYWSEHLDRMPQGHGLPMDRVRPRTGVFEAGSVYLGIRDELFSTLNRFSRTNSKTLYTIMLTALAVVMSRHGNGSDVAIVSPFANRRDKRLEELIGLFVNLVILRLNVPPAITLAALLKDVQATVLRAHQYQFVPFERVIEALRRKRSADTPPVVQVLFAFQNMRVVPPRWPGLETTQIVRRHTKIGCDLAVYVRRQNDGLHCEWQYSTAVFDEWRISQMATHFERVLMAIVSNPEQQVANVELLSQAEKRALLRNLSAGSFAASRA